MIAPDPKRALIIWLLILAIALLVVCGVVPGAQW